MRRERNLHDCWKSKNSGEILEERNKFFFFLKFQVWMFLAGVKKNETTSGRKEFTIDAAEMMFLFGEWSFNVSWKNNCFGLEKEKAELNEKERKKKESSGKDWTWKLS